MKSAIVVVNTAPSFGKFIKGFDADRLPGATRVSENVWEIDMSCPDGLVELLHHARDMEYRLLYLEKDYEWIKHPAKVVS